jgi:hypothetical protein
MVEIPPKITRYVHDLVRVRVGPVSTFDADASHADDTEYDAAYAPYVEAHSQLDFYGVGAAFRAILGEMEDVSRSDDTESSPASDADQTVDPQLELGLPTRNGEFGGSITLRWERRKVKEGLDVEVSKGIRVDLRDKSLRLSYLVPSNRDKLNLQDMIPEERAWHEAHKIELGGWRPLLEVDAKLMQSSGELTTDILSHWLRVARDASKPYFDYTNQSHRSSDQEVTAKRIRYEVDPDDSQVYIKFEN